MTNQQPPTEYYFRLRKSFWKEQFQALYGAVGLDRRVELDCADEDLPLAYVKLSKMHGRDHALFEVLPSDISRR